MHLKKSSTNCIRDIFTVAAIYYDNVYCIAHRNLHDFSCKNVVAKSNDQINCYLNIIQVYPSAFCVINTIKLKIDFRRCLI